MPLLKFSQNGKGPAVQDAPGQAREAVEPGAEGDQGGKRMYGGSAPFGSTPHVPEVVIHRLPELLQRGCAPFGSERERDVFLTGALAVLSGCFPTVYGQYDGVNVWPNLYSITVADAAAGKGALRWSGELGMAYHQHLIALNETSRQAYRQALQGYGGKPGETRPAPPPFLQLFIPADSSAACFKDTLRDTAGRGVMCETEADTLAEVLSQDWGRYSDLLRKAFHHERISYKRKSGVEKGFPDYAQIDQPCLSVALTGTRDQLLKLIPSAENGLFSRFLFYCFTSDCQWRDVSPQGSRPNLNAYFSRLSEDVFHVITGVETAGEIEFKLKPGHWQHLNQTFAGWLAEVSRQISKDLASVVKRLGVITFRIAMLLTVLRKYQQGNLGKEMECEDIDFDSALRLVKVYKEHALAVYAVLPKGSQVRLTQLQRQFLEALPDGFSREEAAVIAERFSIAGRTLTNYLNRWVEDKLLLKEKQGYYRKQL